MKPRESSALENFLAMPQAARSFPLSSGKLMLLAGVLAAVIVFLVGAGLD